MKEDVIGRFAPSPTGRMHLGNIFAALLSWADAKSRGGRWLLRHEDLDPQRSRAEYALQIEDDLAWLGLVPDGEPTYQSRRYDRYEHMLDLLHKTGLTYPCRCTRADILATRAPHLSDGRVVYSGRCRPSSLPFFAPFPAFKHSVRLYVPDSEIRFTDVVFGEQRVNLARECGDFIVRRSDGAWAYQLAVVTDDAESGVTRVVRGNDLLLSAAQQIYLYGLLGLKSPEFMHIPLICNSAGQRLSKRDKSMAMDSLRLRYTPSELIGHLAALAGITPDDSPLSPSEFLARYSLARIPAVATLSCE